MLCKNCGRSIEFNKKFCKCGEDPIGENKNDFEFIEKLLYTELDTIPNIPSPSKKRKGSLIAVILPICFVLVVVVVGAIAFPRLLTNLPTGKNISDSIQRGDEMIVKLPKGEKLYVYTKKSEKFKQDKQLKDGDKLIISKTPELSNGKKYFLIIDGEFKDKYIRKRDMKKYLQEVSEATTKKTQTTYSTTTTITTPNTTTETTLNEPYYIKLKYDLENNHIQSIPMYREANNDSKVKYRLTPNGKTAIKVTVLNQDDANWWEVKYKGKTGYIHKDNLVRDKQKATTMTTTTTTTTETTAQNTRAYQTYTMPTNQNNYANNQNLKSKNQHNDKIDVKDGL